MCPSNIRLLKIDNNCKFGDIHIHGGYQCNTDGKLINNCFPSFCVIGYTFNNKDIKCIKIYACKILLNKCFWNTGNNIFGFIYNSFNNNFTWF